MSPTSSNDHEAKKDRWAAGVTPYREMGYYDADYEPRDRTSWPRSAGPKTSATTARRRSKFSCR
jgi:hypothetical protein